MKRSILISLICLVIALTGIMPAFAASPASGSTLETQVKYEAIKTDWLWSVPATQTFTDGSLTKTGDVSITPANSDDVIILDEGTTIDVSLNSANTFKLKNTDKSTIPYDVKKNGTVLSNGNNVLHFEAGVSANTGIAQTLSFETTAAKVKEAKLTGQHTDIVTFNLDVQGPVIPGATFSDGTELTWSELRLAENGTKYGYDASAVTDTSIGANAFKSRRSLTSITIPSSVTSIGKYAFDSCENLASVAFEGGSQLTSIGESAFQNCYSLTSITIPDSLTSIGISAFQYCHRLTSITIPNSVISIGYGVYGAFHCCNSLTEINVDANNQNYSSVDGVLFNKEKNTLIQYPAGKTGSYTIPDSVTSIRDYAFWYCTNLTSINIPNSVQSVGDLAFGSCSKLTSITIPSSVTSIGTRAFDSCSNLTDINYNGTQDQWNAITFGTNWNVSTGNYTIHCTDGDIAKS